MVYVLPPQLQLHQRREQEPSTGVDIDRDAAAGGGLNGRCVVGAEGWFSVRRGRERIDDTPRPRLDLIQAAVALCL